MQGKDKNSNLFKAQSLDELLSTCPVNQIIGDNLVRAWSKINSPKYKKIVCSISGGSDSDVMLDIVWRCDKDNKVEYVWFDTGLEYPEIRQFVKTFDNVTILRPKKSFKEVINDYGYPIISKEVSECVDQARKAITSGKYCYRLEKIEGIARDKDGNLSIYNIPKWKFLLDAPFKISNR